MSFLVLDRLSKVYGDTIALDGLSLSVERGEFLSLLGPSGCGKTTTLQMIAGFVEPSVGAITLDGSDLLAVKPSRRGIGIVFQSYALFPHMTAAENVAFGLEAQGVKRDERDKRVAEALALVGLAAFAERYPRKLSGGQQQRVALARALVISPRLLLLDEPLSNLDAKLREEMQIELRQIQRRIGTTTILVTHDQAEALALSDRIVVMNKGRAEQIARPDEAYENPASHFVAGFLGKTNVLPALVREAGNGFLVMVGGADWPVESAAILGPAVISVRPERISFTAVSGLAGIVRNRVFHGAQWLLQLDSAAGSVTVIRQNDGAPVPLEGESVVMTWRSEDMHITARAGTRAA
jgi:putative spermidine/putrescine transport system ATP-binding protein